MSLDPNRTPWGDSAAARYQVLSIPVNSRCWSFFSPITAMGFRDSQHRIPQYCLGQVCSVQHLLTAKLVNNHAIVNKPRQHTIIKLSGIKI